MIQTLLLLASALGIFLMYHAAGPARGKRAFKVGTLLAVMGLALSAAGALHSFVEQALHIGLFILIVAAAWMFLRRPAQVDAPAPRKNAPARRGRNPR